MGNTFRTLGKKDFGLGASVCTAATWVKIGTFTNDEPNTLYEFGHQNGYIQVKLYDDTADAVVEVGLVRIFAVAPHGYRKKLVLEDRTENLIGDSYDKTKKVKLDPSGTAISYKGQFEIWFKSDATDTLAVASCEILVDCGVTYK